MYFSFKYVNTSSWWSTENGTLLRSVCRSAEDVMWCVCLSGVPACLTAWTPSVCRWTTGWRLWRRSAARARGETPAVRTRWRAPSGRCRSAVCQEEEPASRSSTLWPWPWSPKRRTRKVTGTTFQAHTPTTNSDTWTALLAYLCDHHKSLVGAVERKLLHKLQIIQNELTHKNKYGISTRYTIISLKII